MKNRKTIYFTLAFLATVAVIFFAVFYFQRSDKLRIVFFDVGQGDAILISEGSSQMLIDGGKDGKILLEKIGKYVPFWDRTIETVIETHPDSDHIGGLVDLLNLYKVQTVLKTNMQSSSQTFQALEKEVPTSGAEAIEAKSGDSITFPDGAKAEIIFPFESIGSQMAQDSQTNAASVVIRLTFGKNSFLFTGDLPIAQEQEIIARNINVEADVLKVGHHGSKYSSSNEFLDAVRPHYGIVSVGKNNPYGHPAPETLQRLENHNINIIRTDEVGDIIYECGSPGEQCQRVLD